MAVASGLPNSTVVRPGWEAQEEVQQQHRLSQTLRKVDEDGPEEAGPLVR